MLQVRKRLADSPFEQHDTRVACDNNRAVIRAHSNLTTRKPVAVGRVEAEAIAKSQRIGLFQMLQANLLFIVKAFSVCFACTVHSVHSIHSTYTVPTQYYMVSPT